MSTPTELVLNGSDFTLTWDDLLLEERELVTAWALPIAKACWPVWLGAAALDYHREGNNLWVWHDGPVCCGQAENPISQVRMALLGTPQA